MKRTRVISAVLCGSAASIVIATAAPAAVNKHPKPGTYAQTNASGSKFLMEFTLDKKRRVTSAVHYDHCVTVPVNVPKIKVRHGKFSFDGKVTDVTQRKFKLHLDGKFVTKTKAKGNWTAKLLDKDSCTSKFDYKVKRTGPVGG